MGKNVYDNAHRRGTTTFKQATPLIILRHDTYALWGFFQLKYSSIELHSTKCCYAVCHFGECHYAVCHYGECHYAACHFGECHYAVCYFGECHYTVCHFGEGNYAVVQCCNVECAQCCYTKCRQD
jgi:hypothetical protein